MATSYNRDMHTNSGASGRRNTLRLALLSSVVVLVWLILDRMTKLYFEHHYLLGQESANDYLLFHFKLIHNTGAAWGMFGNSTFMLGITSLLVCVVILALGCMYSKVFERSLSLWEAFSLALVFAGGLGNAFDRFVYGYVVDFIDLTFMNFPVFNVADIGVTCGFISFFIAVLVLSRHDDQALCKEEVHHE